MRAAVRAGQRPDRATTRGCGPRAEVVARHDAVGSFTIRADLPVARWRAGPSAGLVLRTLAVRPCVCAAALSAAAEVLFREPAILLRLGWAPVPIRAGANGRHRHPAGRQPASRPCHPDTLRDEPRRVGVAAGERAQRAGVQAVVARGLVRGKVYAIAGTGLGADRRLVAWVCVSGRRPVRVAGRLLDGTASEKGKAATVTRALGEQARDRGGPGGIRLLLADALSADGPPRAWLTGAQGSAVLVRLPEDRVRDADIAGLAAAGLLPWTAHRSTRTVQGHTARRTVAVTSVGQLRSWESLVAAAATHGVHDATLWDGPAWCVS